MMPVRTPSSHQPFHAGTSTTTLRRGGTKFVVAPKRVSVRIRAILDMPPAPPPDLIDKATGTPCFKSTTIIYSLRDPGSASFYELGQIEAMSSEFEDLERVTKRSCEQLERAEKFSRPQRKVFRGETVISILGEQPDGSECTGAFFFEYGVETKRVLSG